MATATTAAPVPSTQTATTAPTAPTAARVSRSPPLHHGRPPVRQVHHGCPALSALRIASGPPTARAMTVVLAPSGRIVDTALTAPTAACAKGSRRGHRRRLAWLVPIHAPTTHFGPRMATATTAAPVPSTQTATTAPTAPTAARVSRSPPLHHGRPPVRQVHHGCPALSALRIASGPPTARAMTVVLAPSGRIVDTALTAPTAACAKGSRRGHRYRPQAAPSRPRCPLLHSTCAQTGVIGLAMATATTVAWGRSTMCATMAPIAPIAVCGNLRRLHHRCHRIPAQQANYSASTIAWRRFQVRNALQMPTCSAATPFQTLGTDQHRRIARATANVVRTSS